MRQALCKVDPKAHPGAKHRAAAKSGRADKELPRRLTHGPRQSRAKRRFAQRAAIIDTVMLHCLARDQSPPCGGSIGGHIKGQLRVGRLAIPISLVKPLPAGSFARSISRTAVLRSEEHTSELQSLMRISYAVFCLKKKNTKQQ